MSSSRSFLYGDALFETIRVTEDGPRFLDKHVARFKESAAILGFPESAITHGLAAMRGLDDKAPGVWRITVERPQGPFTGEGETTVSYREWTPTAPISLAIVPGLYVPGDSLAELKTTSYLRSVELMRRAQSLGFDDGLGVSTDGRVGETSCRNIFAKIDGVWLTPPIEGLLPGTIRGQILAHAKALGIDVREEPLTLEQLRSASQVVVTSAVVGVLPVTEVDGTTYESDAGELEACLGASVA